MSVMSRYYTCKIEVVHFPNTWSGSVATIRRWQMNLNQNLNRKTVMSIFSNKETSQRRVQYLEYYFLFLSMQQFLRMVDSSGERD